MDAPVAHARQAPLAPSVRSVASAAPHPVALAGLGLCILAFWMLQHPYEGIVHDSILYAFAALARLHPQSLGHDVYLTLGVQDRYTVFSPLVAALIRLVGLERAAEWVTLAAQIGFFGSGWLLARRLMPPTLAVLSLALLVTLPTVYGENHIFSYIEPFMTPRVPAEIFVLLSLAATLRERWVLAAFALSAAVVIHPLMASAGIAFLGIWLVGLPRPRLLLAIGLAGFATLLAVASLTPIGRVARFDAGWFHFMYSRGEYLFPSLWPAKDWAHACVPLATLAVGAVAVAPSTARSVSIAALATGLCGLTLSLLGSDLLRVVLIAQLQPWRWLWLANALAVVLIPVIAVECWRGGDARRATLVLLVAAWVCIDENFAPLVAALAILSATAGGRVTDARLGKLLLASACAVLGIALVVFAAFVLSVLRQLPTIPPDRTVFDSSYLLALRGWKPWEAGGVVPASLFLLAWWVATHRRDLASALAVLVLGAGLCAAFGAFAWNSWTRVDIPDRVMAMFAPWRAAIPPAAQVLWFGSSYPVWFMLERPSYWSPTQMAASVFSERMARELALREWVIDKQKATHDARADLAGLCRNNPSLDYFVTPADMGPTPFPAVGIDRANRDEVVRLYRCADHRG